MAWSKTAREAAARAREYKHKAKRNITLRGYKHILEDIADEHKSAKRKDFSIGSMEARQRHYHSR